MLDHDGLVPLALELIDAVGEQLLNARKRDAVKLARFRRRRERLRRELLAVDCPVFAEDIVPEGFANLILHRVPGEHLMPDMI